MRKSPNAELIGDKNFRSKLNTPALGVDLDAMERNMKAMSEFARTYGVALRPHGKAHKSPQIAKLQIAGGAVGVCCATIGEAEVMAAGGIDDILITAPLPAPPKLARLERLLASVPRLSVVVDLVDTVERMAAFTRSAAHELTVLVDVDVGQRRTGVTDSGTAVQIARRIAGAKGMRLGGLQGYAGNLQALVSYEERAAKCAAVHDKLRALRKHLEDNGLRCSVVTGVGTGTLLADAASGVFTEIQPGSYLYMDAQYSGVEISKENPAPFKTGLRLFTRIISAPHPGAATTDAGHKSMPADGPAAPKVVAGAPEGTVYKYAGDEFGRLEFADKNHRAEVGTLVECHVPHCDTAMAVHDHLLGFRGDTLETTWPIEARGAW
jgi:D-serine deaminase-like pyridoxal phosphate-dependent protein